ncbi:MAG: shikimate kinase [Planctomycetota bacterium]
MTPDLLLIGLRASGKSTLGRALADACGRPFADLDDVVLEHMGYATVADAWSAEGEPAFRDAEVQALHRLLRGGGTVLALGGGTPAQPRAQKAMRSAQRAGSAMVVYLRCAPEELRRRLEITGAGADRPSLTGADPLDEIASVYAQRDPVYVSIADHVIEGIATLDEGLTRLRAIWPKDQAATE